MSASLSRQVHVTHEDGTEGDIGPGDAYVIEPGHDAWVVGDETFVGFEFDSDSAEEDTRRARRADVPHTTAREAPTPVPALIGHRG